MKESLLRFCSEYLVVGSIVILTVLAYRQPTQEEGVIFFLTVSILLITALIIQKILKRIIHKSRPRQSEDVFTPLDTFAFPSGHATGLTVLMLFVFDRDATLGFILLILSTCVLTARILSNVHDIKDIIGGIVLGAVATYFLTTPIQNFVAVYLVPHIFQ